MTDKTKGRPVSLREQAAFFLPLAMTSFVIIITHSLFNAGLARLPEPEILLAAFAVSKSLMFIFQSPIMMIRQTVTALIDHRTNFRRVSLFLAGVTGTVIAFLALTAFSGLSQLIFRHIMGLEGRTLEEAVLLLKIMVLFPVFASVRDYFAGFSLKFRTTPLITLASIARISYVIGFILLLDRFRHIPGAYLTGMMYIGAVSIEAIIMMIGTRLVSKNILTSLDQLAANNQPGPRPAQQLPYAAIFSFFTPLIATTLIQTSLMPIVNSGLARSVDPEMALAVYAVAWGLGMVVLSPLMAFHQVPLNFIDPDKPERSRGVKKFALVNALVMSVLLALLGFTDLGYLVLRHLIGAGHEVSLLSGDVLKLMSLVPFLMVAREYFWGVLMQRRTTAFIWKGKAINLLTLLIVITLMTWLAPPNPAISGAVAMIFCELAEFSYLYTISRKTN